MFGVAVSAVIWADRLFSLASGDVGTAPPAAAPLTMDVPSRPADTGALPSDWNKVDSVPGGCSFSACSASLAFLSSSRKSLSTLCRHDGCEGSKTEHVRVGEGRTTTTT